jgi:hypothetical protein
VRVHTILAIALLLGTSGCSNQKLPDSTVAVLEQADQFELLALNPVPTKSDRAFHGYAVLGAARISQTDTRRRLISALRQSMRESHGTLAACFNPRHGIRATRNGKQADLVICFQCLSFRLYDDSERTFLITDTPRTLFDEVLKSSGVSIERPSL